MKINVADNQLVALLLGENDSNLKALESKFDSKIFVRGNEITIDGPEQEEVSEVIKELLLILEQGGTLDKDSVSKSVDIVRNQNSPSDVFGDRVFITARNKVVTPRTVNQKKYVDSIRKNTVTFGIGPAGTGKSWLAVAMAVASLKNKEVDKILLTRPAVEAGESLGYLPGDLMAKVDPYLRPLYDAFSDMVGVENMGKYFESNIVEVAPLAYMRGRTLNDSFVILDEAQNTTRKQMMMFLTRIGFNTKVVVTGDRTQTDIKGGQSGLSDLENILGGIKGLGFVNLNSSDIVRHRIVQDIVDAFEARGFSE